MLRKLLSLALMVGVAWQMTGCSDSDSAGSARLRSIEISSGTLDPAFKSKTTQYNAYVGETVPALEVLANPEHSTASVTIEEGESTVGATSSTIPLATDSEVITITVIAQDGVTRKDYFITVIRGEAPTNDNTDTGNNGGSQDGADDGSNTDDEDNTTPSGVAHVWNQYQRLKSSPIAANANFSQIISADGNVMAVGAPGETNKSGAVYIYQKQSGSWQFVQRIAPSSLKSDSRFGQSVVLHNSTLAIGAPGASGNFTKQGYVYTYRLQGNSFTTLARLGSSDALENGQFGAALALDNGTLAIGSIQAANNNNQGGKVSVYKLSGFNWELQVQVGGNNFGSHDIYAQSIALDGNTLAVGSFSPDNSCQTSNGDKGSVYVYTRSGSSWNQSQKLTASDGNSSDRFGYSVSLNNDDMAIGAQCEDGVSNGNTSQGAAYVFQLKNNSWQQVQKLTASDGTAHSLFGDKAIVTDEQIIVGASYESSTGLNAAGAAYVFTKTGNSVWKESQVLRASNSGTGDRFSWGMTHNNDELFIGAPNEDSSSVTFEGDNSSSNSGAIYVFK